MLRKALRLHHTIFSKTPLERRRFTFGSVALFPGPKGSVAVIVPKRVLKSAVDRNRLQRRVRHAFQKIPPIPYGVAVYPSREALTTQYDVLFEALVQVLRTR